MMIRTFWIGLPSPVQRICEYAGVALLTIYAFRVLWLNPHDNKIEQQGKVSATEQVRKDEEKIWKDQTDKLKADNADLANQVLSVQSQNVELQKSRDSLVGALNTSITQIKTVQEGHRVEVSNIPASDLDGALRDLSNQLAASPSVTSK